MKSKCSVCALCAAALLLYSLSACGTEQAKQDTSNVINSNEQEVTYVIGTSSDTESAENSVNENTNSTDNALVGDDGLLDVSWFDDAVFIGDSITLKLSYYNDATYSLGNAKFLCGGSLGWGNAQLDLYDENAVHPYYNGELTLTENALTVTGANKAIIGLGMNDIGNYGVDGSIEKAASLLDKIQTNSPYAEIYIESVTPMVEYKQRNDLNNDLIKEFNQKLEMLAYEKGCQFLNTYEAFADDMGNLPEELCGDSEAQGIHFTNDACELWVEYLRSHISAQ